MLLTIMGAILQAYHAKEKTINDCETSNHIAEDLERTSSEVSRKGCSELSQAFAGVRKQGWRTLRPLHLFHLTHPVPLP